jgi:hypothetical protein
MVLAGLSIQIDMDIDYINSQPILTLKQSTIADVTLIHSSTEKNMKNHTWWFDVSFCSQNRTKNDRRNDQYNQ